MESKKDVYVISLDAVDLNLLPISQTPYDGRVVPLWSKSNLDLRKNEYYEFEIKTNDTREEKNDQVIENVICHICEINVPKVYFNEHKNSFRHKFNAKIAYIALRRLQSFMNKDDVNESYEKNPSKYYCSECSLVIDSDDEISHKQSIVHRNSIFLERFLNDFLNFYTNDENEINYSKKENKIAKSDLYSGESNISKTAIINDSKEDREKIEVAKIMKHCRDSEKDFDSDEPNNSKTVTINDSKEDREKIEVAKIMKHCRDSEDFDSDEPNILETVIISDSKTDAKNSTRDLDLDEENKKLDSSSIFHKDLQVKDGVVFETNDGGRFKVTELNFNAIKKIGTLLEYCMICQRIFVIEKRSLHFNSDHHGENMLQKLPDKNCIRKVNNTLNHCILCNNDFDNYEVHIHSKEHITNFQNMMIPDERKKTTENCYNFNTDKIKVDAKTCSDIVKSNTSESSTDKSGYTAPLNNKTINNLNILPSTSLSVDIPGKLFCDSCNVWIGVRRMKKHQNTTKHTLNTMTKNTMTNYHYLLKFLDKDNLCCTICDVTVSNIFDNIQDHFTNVDHIGKYDKLLQANNITKINNKTYYCKECKVYILHKNEYLHIESKQHKDKISFNKTEEIDEYTDKLKAGNAVNVELGNGNAIKTVEPGNAIDNKVVDAVNRLYIPIIDPVTGKDISTFQPANVSEIIKTAGQSENTVIPVSKSYLCNVCQVQVPNNVNNISMHNKGRPHMLKLRQQVDTKVKETSNLHYQMVNTDTKNVVTCIICNVDITASDDITSTHIEGETHKNNYIEFCIRNYLVTIDNDIYCTVCGVNTGVRCEVIHCIGKKHKKNLENVC